MLCKGRLGIEFRHKSKHRREECCGLNQRPFDYWLPACIACRTQRICYRGIHNCEPVHSMIDAVKPCSAMRVISRIRMHCLDARRTTRPSTFSLASYVCSTCMWLDSALFVMDILAMVKLSTSWGSFLKHTHQDLNLRCLSSKWTHDGMVVDRRETTVPERIENPFGGCEAALYFEVGWDRKIDEHPKPRIIPFRPTTTPSAHLERKHPPGIHSTRCTLDKEAS